MYINVSTIYKIIYIYVMCLSWTTPPYTLIVWYLWDLGGHPGGSRGTRVRRAVLLTTVSIWSGLFLEDIRPRPFSISFDDYSQHPIERENSRW